MECHSQVVDGQRPDIASRALANSEDLDMEADGQRITFVTLVMKRGALLLARSTASDWTTKLVRCCRIGGQTLDGGSHVDSDDLDTGAGCQDAMRWKRGHDASDTHTHTMAALLLAEIQDQRSLAIALRRHVHVRDS